MGLNPGVTTYNFSHPNTRITGRRFRNYHLDQSYAGDPQIIQFGLKFML
jgi:hypothetical protein